MNFFIKFYHHCYFACFTLEFVPCVINPLILVNHKKKIFPFGDIKKRRKNKIAKSKPNLPTTG